MFYSGVCGVLCRGFEPEDGKASILLNTAVCGDVTIIVYHARAAFGGKVQGKVCFLILSLNFLILVSEDYFR